MRTTSWNNVAILHFKRACARQLIRYIYLVHTLEIVGGDGAKAIMFSFELHVTYSLLKYNKLGLSQVAYSVQYILHTYMNVIWILQSISMTVFKYIYTDPLARVIL